MMLNAPQSVEKKTTYAQTNKMLCVADATECVNNFAPFNGTWAERGLSFWERSSFFLRNFANTRPVNKETAMITP